MSDLHLTPQLFRAVHEANLGPGDVAALALQHLFELCPICKRGFDAWQEELRTGAASLPGSPEDYGPAIERSRTRFAAKRGETSRAEAEVENEVATARRRVAELVALPAEKRATSLRESPERYHGPALAALLIEESRSRLPGRLDEAHALAGLARTVLQHSKPTFYAVELYARALAHQANAQRTRGDLTSSEQGFEIARYILKIQGGSDRLTTAEIDSFEGSLRRAQRRFIEAERLLSRAALTFRMEGESIPLVRTLLKLGMVYREQSDLSHAIEITSQALDTIEPLGFPHLASYARHNLAHLLQEAGDFQGVRTILDENADVFENHADPSTQLRRLWLEGNIARAEGNEETAEQALIAVRGGFLRQGVPYDAALSAIDLAQLYFSQGRTAELKVLAAEAVKMFESQDIHREAATALVLFQDAVAAEQITLAYLTELTRYLERARLDPTLAFQTPA